MSREVRLARYPAGAPVAADFVLAEAPPAAEPSDGEVVVEVTHLSMDPAPRLRMTATSPMGPPMALGRVVEGRGVGRIAASRAAGFAPGDAVAGELGWRARAVLPAAKLERLEPGNAPLHHHLNALGPTGLAAWFALDAASPRFSETVVIAPAAGAVGNIAMQLALAAGARVAGVGVGSAQCAFIAGLGAQPLDADADPAAALAGGVDVFLDGVGCALHDRIAAHLNPRARVILLGFVAGYGDAAPPRYGDMRQILMRRAHAQGFLLADHMARAPEARAALGAALAAGTLVPQEKIWPGLTYAPAAFAALFGTAPPGKQIVAITEEDR